MGALSYAAGLIAVAVIAFWLVIHLSHVNLADISYQPNNFLRSNHLTVQQLPELGSMTSPPDINEVENAPLLSEVNGNISQQTDGSEQADVGKGEQSKRCKTTVPTRRGTVTDSTGKVCTDTTIDRTTGCCNENALETSSPCESCDLGTGCCQRMELCVACCMQSDSNMLEVSSKVKHFLFRELIENEDWFGYCSLRCRTSSESVKQENSYRSHEHHCFLQHAPLDVLRSVNSDRAELATDNPTKAVQYPSYVRDIGHWTRTDHK